MTAGSQCRMELQFEQLFVTTPSLWNRGERREILRGVSGCFRAGQLSGILGPSGAGKTTLLNAISGYKRRGLRGRLKVNGTSRDENKFRKMSCYITQDDLLIPYLTLGELMGFASVLKLPPAYGRKQRRAVVSEVQSMLGLSEAKDTMTELLSGGQKRRLSIALELINNPPILFLDEPTSGLDNVSASQLIRLLSGLAKAGRTIVCTIHQPSASLFSVFDSVYFLGGGRCVYQGGAGVHLLAYLDQLKMSCPEYYNPADYLIELLEEERNIEVLSTASGNGTVSWYSAAEVLPSSEPSTPSKKECGASTVLQYGRLVGRNEEGESTLPLPCADRFTFWLQFTTLFQRMILQQKRNKTALVIQFYHHVGCALAIGIMFYHKARDGTEFFNHMKFCMGIILFHTYTQCMVPILQYPFEVKLLKKEYFNQWYRLLPYYLAHTCAKAPVIIVLNQLYLTIVYGLSGLPWDLDRFFVFSSVGIMTSFVAEGMGLTISSLFSVTNGSAVGPLTLAPFLGFAIYGFDFARSISPFMTVVVRSSFMRAGVVALILAVFGMDRPPLDCTDPVYCHFQDPRVTLHYLFLEDKSVWDYVLDLFIILCFFRLAFYYGLKWRLRSS